MERVHRTLLICAAFAVILHLTGCDRQQEARETGAPEASLAAAQPSQPAIPAPAAAASEAPFPDAERDPAKVLEWWGAALERRDWTGARRIWGQFGAASGLTAEEYARQWEPYRTVKVTVGTGVTEGAAGSLYYEVPVSISGTRQTGQPFTVAGLVTLRRVNDVDGATAEQLRWHIERSTMQP